MSLLASSTCDPITHLPARAAFVTDLVHDVERAERKRTQITLLLVTLDGLPRAYAALGQAGGDHLVATVATRLRKAVRGTDRVAQWDETTFAVLLLDVRGGAHVSAVAWRVRLACTAETREGMGDIRLEARIGYARYPENGGGPEELLAHAAAASEAGSEEHHARVWVTRR